MLSYINILKIKKISLQCIKDYRLARSERNEKHETQKHTCKLNTCCPVLFPLCSDVSCQLLCTLCAEQELCVPVLIRRRCLWLS